MNEFNFFSSSQDSDKDLFFSDQDGVVREEFRPLEEGWIMAHILANIGLFPSVSQARKNGWDKPIPSGFSDFKGIGKNKVRITIFKEKV